MTADRTPSEAGLVVDVPRALLDKYDRVGPRYTSYPTAPTWSEDFGARDWAAALARADARPEAPLGLYVHLPFCRERCLFCACNVVIGRRQDVVDDYLDLLEREIDAAAARLPHRRRVSSLHWGGGTPTHLSPAEIERVAGRLFEHFELLPDAEVSIEVHPPVTTRAQMETLARLGFNRVSLGVQDLDQEVQRIINRHQTIGQTEEILTTARELGFASANFDLIYGLPGQTAATWELTLDEVLRMRPDRLAIYSYAHVPWIHPHQERMPADRMPGPEDKLAMIRRAKERLAGDGGYRQIGFDHFAVPEDSMVRAADEHRLYRNFMGFTVKPGDDYVGLGVSAISEVGGAFVQNHAKLNRWREAVSSGEPPVHRGLRLSADDRVRKTIIERLMCNLWLDFDEFEDELGAPFQEAFPDAWQELGVMEEDGLVVRGARHLEVTDLGRTFLRNVCMLFDAYLDQQAGQRFSRTV